MKRRLLLVLAIAIALCTAGGPATAVVSTSSSYWGCAGNDDVNIGICLKNPLPDIPEIPRLPL